MDGFGFNPDGGMPVIDDGSTLTGWEKVLDDLISQGSRIAQIVVGPPAPVGGVGVRPPAQVPGAAGPTPTSPVGPLGGVSQLGILFLLLAVFVLILALGVGKKKAAA